MTDTPAAVRLQTEEIRRPVRHRRRQHRAVHRRPQRQRSALSRLRHPRCRRRSREFEEIAHLLVHGKLPTAAELTAYKTKLKALRGLPAAVKAALEQLPAVGASDGRDAHRRLGARLRAAREGRPQHAGRARHRRPADGLARLDAAVLVSLQPQRQAHRGRDRRRLHRRPLPAPAASARSRRARGSRRCTRR